MDKASKNLKRSVYTLFFIGLIGQAAFAIYIFLHLGLSALRKDWSVWTEGMANGIIEGDQMGNFALVMHVILAFFVTVGGPLQFIPSFRSTSSKFHKWNGRIYIFLIMTTSIIAFFLVWSRPIIIGGLLGNFAISGNAILIILFSIMTWREAMQGKFESHRVWAIRTYLVVSGVWFFRIGFGTWYLVTGFTGPGITEDLTGWFNKILYFASYLGPLLVAELYMKAKRSENEKFKGKATVFLYLLCPLLIGGTVVTTMFFWWP